MSYVNNSTLEGPGAELNVFKLHTRAFEWHIALHRIVFSLWAVSVKSNFSVADLASKQSTQRAVLLFCSNLSTRIWFLCASCNSPVAFGCMWALFMPPWWLCYKTSKSRFSDFTIQQKTMRGPLLELAEPTRPAAAAVRLEQAVFITAPASRRI